MGWDNINGLDDSLLQLANEVKMWGEKWDVGAFTLEKVFRKDFTLDIRKFLIFLLIILLFLILTYVIISNERLIELLERLLIRPDSLKTGTGRFDLWENGIEISLGNNFLFGIGRYRGIQLSNLMSMRAERYFHSLYIEVLVSYGIIGLILLIAYLYHKYRMIKEGILYNANLVITKATMAAFLVVSFFESVTRFSIGYADTFGLIFYFSIITLMINTSKSDMSVYIKHK